MIVDSKYLLTKGNIGWQKIHKICRPYLSLFLEALLIAIGLLILADGTWAGVVTEGRDSDVSVLICSSRWTAPDCDIDTISSVKSMTGFGSINDEVSKTIDGKLATANGNLSVVSLGKEVQIKGSTIAVNKGLGRNLSVSTTSTVTGMAALVMDVSKPTRITLEISMDVLIERSVATSATNGVVSIALLTEDFTSIISDNVRCINFSPLLCTRKATQKRNLDIVPGQKIIVFARAVGNVFSSWTLNFPGELMSSVDFDLAVRVIEEGCSGLKVEAHEDVLPFNSGITGDTSTTITASVSNPAPAGGCDVTFEQPKAVSYSGGHSHHNNDRPHGTLDKTSCTIETGITFCTAKYTASEVSGEETIKAKLTSTGEEAEGKVTIKVPNLVSLESKPNLLPWGQTDKHIAGTNNHGTTYTRDAVYYTVSEYAREYGMEPDIYLAVIDMSLPWGGLFDIKGNWTTPHDWHRVGRSVDFSKHYRDSNGKEIEVVISDEDGNVIEITKIIDDDKLDEFFEDENFECSRQEKDIGLIHYQCPK